MLKGDFGYYYWMQEIIPFAKGIYRFDHRNAVEEFEVADENSKAIVESQFMSMRIRLERMTKSPVKRILASGGAAANNKLLQVLSNVLGLPVYKQHGMNGASLGGALLAKFGVYQDSSFEDMMAAHPSAELELVCEPDTSRVEKYTECVEEFVELEKRITKE
jgi:xylulokinase